MRVGIVDDSVLFREGIKILLEADGVDVVYAVGSVSELLNALEQDISDAIILDIRMPPNFSDEGLAAASLIREKHPSIGILVLSTYGETAYAARLLQNASVGVGYLLKDQVDTIGSLRSALERVKAGEVVLDPSLVTRLITRQAGLMSLQRLSEREKAVLHHMAEGRSNAGIGLIMSLSPRTVENHVAAVFAKLDVAQGETENRRVLAVLNWLRLSSEH